MPEFRLDQLGAQDAQFVYMETKRNLSNVSMICLLSKPRGVAQQQIVAHMKSHFKSRVSTSPIFTRKLKKLPLNADFPYWVEDEAFAFDDHFFAWNLPAPADWNQFRRLVGEVHSTPLNMCKPLWEVHVVTGLKQIDNIPQGGFALIIKLHHSAVDGETAMLFFKGLTDDATASLVASSSAKPHSTAVAPTNAQIILRAIKHSSLAPIKFSSVLLRTAPSILQNISKKQGRTTKGTENHSVPESVFNQAASAQKTFDAIDFPLSDFRSIAELVDNAKINDVVLAVTSGGLRRYLLEFDALPSSPLVAWVPINTRKPSARKVEVSNSVSAMTVGLQTHIGDAVTRLKQITQDTQRVKLGESGHAVRLIADLSQQLPGMLLDLTSKALIATGATAKMCNLAVSNVPGPSNSVSMAGAECLKQYGMVPLAEGLGLFLVAQSYRGRLSFTMTATEDAVVDSALLMSCIESSFEELKATSSHLKATQRH